MPPPPIPSPPIYLPIYPNNAVVAVEQILGVDCDAEAEALRLATLQAEYNTSNPLIFQPLEGLIHFQRKRRRAGR